MTSRLSADEYFIEIARTVAKRATCLRHNVGAVLVKDKHILTTGYNGSPSGMAHCLDIGCIRDKLGIKTGERIEICRGVHAEANAVVQAAIHGTDTRGSTLYCTHKPCLSCVKMIISAGVKKIVFLNEYKDALNDAFMREAGIECVQFVPEQKT